MADITATIKILEGIRYALRYDYVRDGIKAVNGLNDAIELLKEQKEREKNICKRICDFIRGGCSTDTDDDKDFVCYEIQKCFTEGR